MKEALEMMHAGVRSRLTRGKQRVAHWREGQGELQKETRPPSCKASASVAVVRVLAAPRQMIAPEAVSQARCEDLHAFCALWRGARCSQRARTANELKILIPCPSEGLPELQRVRHARLRRRRGGRHALGAQRPE